MPATSWDDIAGYECEECGEAATHWYGGVAICCECHAGPGNGLCPDAAHNRRVHEAILRQRGEGEAG